MMGLESMNETTWFKSASDTNVKTRTNADGTISDVPNAEDPLARIEDMATPLNPVSWYVNFVAYLLMLTGGGMYYWCIANFVWLTYFRREVKSAIMSRLINTAVWRYVKKTPSWIYYVVVAIGLGAIYYRSRSVSGKTRCLECDKIKGLKGKHGASKNSAHEDFCSRKGKLQDQASSDFQHSWWYGASYVIVTLLTACLAMISSNPDALKLVGDFTRWFKLTEIVTTLFPKKCRNKKCPHFYEGTLTECGACASRVTAALLDPAKPEDPKDVLLRPEFYGEKFVTDAISLTDGEVTLPKWFVDCGCVAQKVICEYLRLSFEYVIKHKLPTKTLEARISTENNQVKVKIEHTESCGLKKSAHDVLAAKAQSDRRGLGYTSASPATGLAVAAEQNKKQKSTVTEHESFSGSEADIEDQSGANPFPVLPPACEVCSRVSDLLNTCQCGLRLCNICCFRAADSRIYCASCRPRCVQCMAPVYRLRDYEFSASIWRCLRCQNRESRTSWSEDEGRDGQFSDTAIDRRMANLMSNHAAVEVPYGPVTAISVPESEWSDPNFVAQYVALVQAGNEEAGRAVASFDAALRAQGLVPLNAEPEPHITTVQVPVQQGNQEIWVQYDVEDVLFPPSPPPSPHDVQDQCELCLEDSCKSGELCYSDPSGEEDDEERKEDEDSVFDPKSSDLPPTLPGHEESSSSSSTPFKFGGREIALPDREEAKKTIQAVIDWFAVSKCRTSAVLVVTGLAMFCVCMYFLKRVYVDDESYECPYEQHECPYANCPVHKPPSDEGRFKKGGTSQHRQSAMAKRKEQTQRNLTRSDETREKKSGEDLLLSNAPQVHFSKVWSQAHNMFFYSENSIEKLLAHKMTVDMKKPVGAGWIYAYATNKEDYDKKKEEGWVPCMRNETWNNRASKMLEIAPEIGVFRVAPFARAEYTVLRDVLRGDTATPEELTRLEDAIADGGIGPLTRVMALTAAVGEKSPAAARIANTCNEIKLDSDSEAWDVERKKWQSVHPRRHNLAANIYRAHYDDRGHLLDEADVGSWRQRRDSQKRVMSRSDEMEEELKPQSFKTSDECWDEALLAHHTQYTEPLPIDSIIEVERFDHVRDDWVHLGNAILGAKNMMLPFHVSFPVGRNKIRFRGSGGVVEPRPGTIHLVNDQDGAYAVLNNEERHILHPEPISKLKIGKCKTGENLHFVRKCGDRCVTLAGVANLPANIVDSSDRNLTLVGYTAPTRPGDSGTGVFNDHGHLVGMHLKGSPKENYFYPLSAYHQVILNTEFPDIQGVLAILEQTKNCSAPQLGSSGGANL